MNGKRYFWPGHLIGGMGVMYQGRICHVALDSQIADIEKSVPNGHVPIFFDAIYSRRSEIFTVPLDDLVFSCKR